MVSRLALLACAAAGLALAVPARAATEMDQEGAVQEGAAPDLTGSEAAPVRARVRRHVRRPIRVSVVPPVRPSDVAGFAGPIVPASDGSTGTSFEQQAGIKLPEPPAPVVLTVQGAAEPTDLRSSLAEAVPPAIEPVVTARAGDAPLPPARPDLVELAAPEAPALVAVRPPHRPAFEPDPVETASLPEAPAVAAPSQAPPAEPARSLFGSLFNTAPVAPAPVVVRSGRAGLDDLIAIHAKLNGVPADLVHRIVVRESKYNPGAVGRGGAMGLMQIKHGTARAMGYGGTAAGLLDAETNITYAVKYLAGAYRVAGGNYDGAVRNYARGYYHAAKRQRLAETSTRGGRRGRLRREANASTGLDWAPATEMSLPAQAGGAAALRR